MPFVNAHGTSVTDAEALDASGAVKPGYRVMMGHGEYVGFDMAFMDSAAPSRMTFRDTAPTPIVDAEVNRAVARARSHHVQRHAWMGNRAPVFTDAMAQAAAGQFIAGKRAFSDAQPSADVRQAVTDTARAIRDNAMAERKDRIRNAWRS